MNKANNTYLNLRYKRCLQYYAGADDKGNPIMRTPAAGDFYHFGIGDGWFGLMIKALDAIEKAMDEDPEWAKTFYISQIKEKFGSLRVYISSGPDWLHDVLWEVEKESSCVCEECGKKGKTLRNSHSWYHTLCLKHHLKMAIEHVVGGDKIALDFIPILVVKYFQKDKED